MVRRCRHPMFKGRHFDQEIIILCVRWYVTYKLSYRDLAAMMLERGTRWHRARSSGGSNGTCPSSRSAGIDSLARSAVPGALTRPTSGQGPVALPISSGRQAGPYRRLPLRQDRGIAAAQAFFRKAFASHPNRPPQKVTLDGHRPSHRALRLLRREHPAWRRVHVRTCKYLNNIVDKITERSSDGVRRCSGSSPSRPQR